MVGDHPSLSNQLWFSQCLVDPTKEPRTVGSSMEMVPCVFMSRVIKCLHRRGCGSAVEERAKRHIAASRTNN